MKMAAVSEMNGAEPDVGIQINADSQSQSSQDSLTSADSFGQVILRKLPKSNEHHNGDVRNSEEELIRRRSSSVLEVTEHAHARLRDELFKALQELKLKDEECKKLSHVQEQMEKELEELTASLFEEANKMVQDANVKRMNQEKLLKEANAKVEILEAEVTALKSLVITSTPSMPNRHLHPQLEASQAQPKKAASFIKGHRRSTSHHNISSEIKLSELKMPIVAQPLPMPPAPPPQREIDPIYFEEFKHWKDNSPSLDLQHGFLARIVKEDIVPCLNFYNAQLAKSAFDCIVKNTLTIDPVQERNPFPCKCVLTATNQICKYKMKLGDSDESLLISQLARNRLAAVCDFFTYLRYISHGLVKSDETDIYWQVMRLREEICHSRLGWS